MGSSLESVSVILVKNKKKLLGDLNTFQKDPPSSLEVFTLFPTGGGVRKGKSYVLASKEDPRKLQKA